MYPGLPPTVCCRPPLDQPATTDSQRKAQTELQEAGQATDGSHSDPPYAAEDGEGSSQPQHHESHAACGAQRQGLDPEAGAGTGVSSMLTVQYRMHSSIMQWSSDEMYKVRGCTHNSKAHSKTWLYEQESSLDAAGCMNIPDIGLRPAFRESSHVHTYVTLL